MIITHFLDIPDLQQAQLIHELQTQNLLTLAESVFCSSDDANVAKLRSDIIKDFQRVLFRFAKAVLLLPIFARIEPALVRQTFFPSLTVDELNEICGFSNKA
jgi:hypothetical protein